MRHRPKNIATVLWQIKKGRETASQIAQHTGLSPTTCSNIQQFLHNNLIGYRFKDSKNISARIYGHPVDLTVITKPMKWNESLLTKIIEFVKNPTFEEFVELKKKALRFFSCLTNNFTKFPRGVRQKFTEWKRNVSPMIINFFEIASPPPC